MKESESDPTFLLAFTRKYRLRYGMDMKAGIETAIKTAGSVPELARALGVTPHAVYMWRRAGKIPAERAVEIAGKYQIPVTDLRPDMKVSA